MNQALLITVLALEGLIFASFWIFLYQVLKQQGRLLLRIDGLERRLSQSFAVPPGCDDQPANLAVGTAILPFQLPDLEGHMMSLQDFKNKRVLLIHWSPGCGYCEMIAPELVGLQKEFERKNIQVLLLGSGKAEANRKLTEKHGMKYPVLLLQNAVEPVPIFEHLGTPAAYLLDEEGRIAEPLAIGANKVPALARKAAGNEPAEKRLPGERPLSESRIERNGLKIGAPAPPFVLPAVSGGDFSLDQLRGKQILLVFSDPDCAPCNHLAPRLAQLHREHENNGFAIVMVGRGDLEENRRKAKEYGLEFPVAVQSRWELSRKYGIFSTPVAFLIGEDGLIKDSVAKGPDEILALAQVGTRKQMEISR